MVRRIMKKTCIILDWDGTVANTVPVWIQVFSALFKNHNINLSDQEIFENVYGIEKGPAKYGIEDYKEFNQQAFQQIRKLFSTIPLFPHSSLVIKKMSDSGCDVAVVTSTPNKLIKEALDYHRLTNYIGVTIGRDDVSEIKPNPQGILKATSILKCDVDNTISVGDSKSDLLASKSAKLKTVLYTPEYKFAKPKLNFEVKPDRTFHDWQELPFIINSMIST